MSIKKYIDYYGIKNRINQHKESHKGSFLIVEGESDTRIFKKFIDNKKCLVIHAYGKGNIHKLIQKEHFGKRDEILFVADMDCEKINKDPEMAENLFLTDTHDRECDIIRSQDFDRYLKMIDFSEECKIEIEELKKIILEECKLIGLLRCYNEKNNLGLPFDKIIETDEDLEYLLTDKGSINFEKIITKLKNHPLTSDEAKSKINDISALKDELEKKGTTLTVLWCVCNGHDITKFLCIFLKRKCHLKAFEKITSKQFEEDILTLIYSITEFQKTNLYLQIRKWEETHAPYCVF
ncbi:MAG: hypothetical protein Q8S57_09450 [Methanoregula sp.]|nr:hypothetical protein [Methanoregula sp.]